jgi:hypothetical protein
MGSSASLLVSVGTPAALPEFTATVEAAIT